MKVLVRKSVAGAEYWDTKEKRSIFVPKGMEPDFEVASENPATMITPEGDTKIISVDSSSGKDRTVVAVMKQEEGKVIVESMDLTESPEQTEPNADLESKTIKELRAIAKKEGIDIPNAIRTKGDIINIIESSK